MSLAPSIEKSALVSSSSRGGRGNFMGHGRGGRSAHLSEDRDSLKYEHCNRFRHTKDQCWDLHGRPPDLTTHSAPHGGFVNGRGGGRSGGQRPSAHSVTSTSTELSTQPPLAPSDIGGLSSDEITAFRRFVFQLDHSSTTPTSSFAHSSAIAHGLSITVTTPQRSWIIDSGASHHMTGISSLFNSYQVCSGKDKV